MYLRNYVAADQRDWTKWLALAEFCYNSHKHTATKQSPSYVAKGFEPLTHVELALELKDEKESSPSQDGEEPSIPRGGENDLGIMGMFDVNAQEYISQRELTLRNVKISLELAQKRYQKMANKDRRDVRYLVGTKVWLAIKNLPMPEG